MADLPSTSQPPTTDSTQAGPDQTLDGTLDIDIDMNLNPQPEPGSREATTEAIPEPPPAPTKKDITLREFLSKMDDYAPIVRPRLHSLPNPPKSQHISTPAHNRFPCNEPTNKRNRSPTP